MSSLRYTPVILGRFESFKKKTPEQVIQEQEAKDIGLPVSFTQPALQQFTRAFGITPTLAELESRRLALESLTPEERALKLKELKKQPIGIKKIISDAINTVINKIPKTATIDAEAERRIAQTIINTIDLKAKKEGVKIPSFDKIEQLLAQVLSTKKKDVSPALSILPTVKISRLSTLEAKTLFSELGGKEFPFKKRTTLQIADLKPIIVKSLDEKAKSTTGKKFSKGEKKRIYNTRILNAKKTLITQYRDALILESKLKRKLEGKAPLRTKKALGRSFKELEEFEPIKEGIVPIEEKVLLKE